MSAGITPPAPTMTCTTCYHVNPTGASRCYNCGTPLVPTPVYGTVVDAWTHQDQGPDPRTDRGYRAGATTPHGDTAADDASYRAARAPDLIYNPDGTIAVDTPPRYRRPAGRQNGWMRLLAPLAPFLVLLGKLKFLLLVLPKLKLGLTAVTMLVSVVTYAWVWGLGWSAALGFVALLFIHEMGHWIVMRFKGVRASVPVFIPFLGAVIGMRGMPRSVKDEAEIGIAGPIAGTAGALVCLGLGTIYHSNLWSWLTVMGLVLNLFNLLPVSPLDGGRIVAAISRWLWVAGLVGLVVLFIVWPNPFLLLVALIGGAETVARFRGRYAPTARPGYYDVSTMERVTMGALYFGLIALIAVTMLTNPLAHF